MFRQSHIQGPDYEKPKKSTARQSYMDNNSLSEIQSISSDQSSEAEESFAEGPKHEALQSVLNIRPGEQPINP